MIKTTRMATSKAHKASNTRLRYHGDGGDSTSESSRWSSAPSWSSSETNDPAAAAP
jgi:hypothetical protein